MKSPTSLAALLALSLATTLHAAGTPTAPAASAAAGPTLPTSCRQLEAEPGQVITLTAAVNLPVHITLPEEITHDVPGNAKLWQVNAQGAHYWAKPADPDSPYGAAMTLTLTTASHTYDFVIRRGANPDVCVLIDDTRAFGAGAIPATPTPEPAAVAMPLHTAYRWRSHAIEAVYDDGRRTYVRLAPRSEGEQLPALTAGDAKHPELVDAQYDAGTRTYAVNGIYDALTLTVDRKTDTIARAN
jgi:hypothetical protein